MQTPAVVLSFDVELHHWIEAAAGLECPPARQQEYADRMDHTTRRLLDLLAEYNAPATFFIVGQIAETHPSLVRAIADAGHEIASHGWDHSQIHKFTPDTFRTDLRRAKDALEQASGKPVVGFRAPTFSLVRKSWWAVDVLADSGFVYDSSVFPVRHDRYGIPEAPRTPFIAQGKMREILELPPATYQVFGQNLPVAGGGYFRLFPPAVMRAGLAQLGTLQPAVGVLYFHPWEFDPDQPRLPLGGMARWRTYVGVSRTTGRLRHLLKRYRSSFRRAGDVAAEMTAVRAQLPRFQPTES